MQAQQNLPSINQIWEWLKEVPDPEVPVVSVVDLGIVRDVSWQADELVVTVTPTYSGCPATGVIALDIETALRDHGLDQIKIERKLSPAWTTDWLSAEGREKLRQYGIAPPTGDKNCSQKQQSEQMTCPACGSDDTECVSWFGSTACKASYRCKSCLEPFDYFKCI